ncbi:unnamed protein product [Aphanomyces euteiches]|uniref:Myb-like domain-containing protein n=1 Tax=Aphanomyces euteiches TaxID=100861 RepID=A0A6G0WS86_9STRA|nr:hypothetical protein Ae201684_012338 [Aphanomyces euteiches]KAH9096587.1 hypothetical protein Ae201684P_013253 [Aphanomyces euteiches]KAH9157237.1 hypothetical protein AeRB84_000912 [Aphanomyces euteiches]
MNHAGLSRDQLEKQYGASSASSQGSAATSRMLPPQQKISRSNVYSTAQAAWSPEELHLLHKGLTEFPSERYDNITRYIKIAATIPDKSIRDVAYKIRSMDKSVVGNNNQLPQQSHMLPAMAQVKRQKVEHNDHGMQPLIPLTIKKETISSEDSIKKSLQDNANVINSIRANLASGELHHNFPLMAHFRDNCSVILKKLSAMCSAVPPMSVQIDTSLLAAECSNNQDNV